jgi:accessory gene regulator B
LIIKFAENLAYSLKKTNPEQTASVDVMKYALIGIINTVGTLLVSLLIGLITGKFIETILALSAFALLRFFSGGYHLKTPSSCIIVSSLIICSIPHIPLNGTAQASLMIISSLLVLVYAPSNIRGFARLPEKYFPILKLISIMIISTNWLLGSSIFAVAYFLQSISLIRLRKEV